MWPGPNGDPDWDRAGRWVDETARIRGITPEAVIARVLDNWFADPYVAKNNHPTRHFAKHFGNYIDASGRNGSVGRNAAPVEYVENLGEFGDA